MKFDHMPVMLNECIDNLQIKEDGIYVDGTLGGAGHGREIYRRLSGKGTLVGIDQDQAALEAARNELDKVERQAKKVLIKGNFREIDKLLSNAGVEKADGILLDLGVSSYQLDNPERGFSYRFDAKLDMRMDSERRLKAYDVVNTYSENELRKIFYEYGEERFSPKIARRIVDYRKEKPIENTLELVEIIKESIPYKMQTDGHPAKRVFQAIRIEVNQELRALEEVIDKAIPLLNAKGRLCIISFHSLEDRIVKDKFRENENPCSCPPSFPICVCGKVSRGKVISKKPIYPSKEEININTRAKSAKLRVFQAKE